MNAMRYVLGVDGGNTKTDYLLYSIEGRLIHHLRAGTCSHEILGMEGAHREMDKRVTELLHGAQVMLSEVEAAAFGLAGIDQPLQQQALADIVQEIGFVKSVAANDSFLGIKAGSAQGVGICSINGTQTSSGGIGLDGQWMQVGGLGVPISGDEAGGQYIARRTLRAAYDAIYRFGEETAIRPCILALFGCPAESLHQAISTDYMFGTQVEDLDIIRILFACSGEGDPVAAGIVRETADALARSAAGCAVRLRFEPPIPVILIGSVWTKGRHQPMMDHFKAQFERYAGMACALTVLDVPPAAGSILWAMELATGTVPDETMREKVFSQLRDL